jgi:surfeit locus 1 family protein
MRAPRSAAVQIVLLAIAGLICAGFVALGIWQLERRIWKLNLIERVEQRIHAPATDFPPSSQWSQWSSIRAGGEEYRRVRVSGHFLYDQETLVQASTELGSGFWVMTPLRMADGSTVLINRGFITAAGAPRAAAGAAANVVDAVDAIGPAGPTGHTQAPQTFRQNGSTTITGLVRITQPGGGFLRRNDPAANRWFSRDVQAIAAARGLQNVAPVFIDADAGVAATENHSTPSANSNGSNGTRHTADNPVTAPVGGLTVIAFPNNHLVYAFTWFALALMTAAAGWFLIRSGRALPGSRSEYTAR